MRIARRFAAVLAALCVVVGSSSAKAALSPTTSPVVAKAVVLTYDPKDGSLVASGGGLNMSALEIKSKGNLFNPAGAAPVFSGLFDVKTKAKLFKLEPSGFGQLAMGNVLPPKLATADLIKDLDINGALVPSGGLASGEGGGPYLYTVPEPSSLVLVGLSCLGLLATRRK